MSTNSTDSSQLNKRPAMSSASNRQPNAGAKWLALLLIAGLVSAPLLLSPLVPARTLLWLEIQNAAHFILFFIVAWLFIAGLKFCRRDEGPVAAKLYWQALGLSVLLGAVTEGLQFFLPRDADIVDFLRNCAGAFVGLSVYRSLDLFRQRENHKFRDWLLLSLAGLVVLASLATVAGWAVSYLERDSRFPVLADFEPRPWPTFVTPKGARLRWVPAPAGFGADAQGRVLEVAFYRSAWPGFAIREPVPDWRGYTVLELAVLNPSKNSRTLHIRIDDALYTDGYDDRYNGVFVVAPGASLVRVPISAVRNGPRDRLLDLSRIQTLIIFAQNQDEPFLLFFDNLRLLSDH